MGPLQISFFSYYVKAQSDQFLHILCGGGGGSDQFHYKLYWGPPPDQAICILYGAHSDQFLHIIYEGPLNYFLIILESPSDQFLHILHGGPHLLSFFTYYMGAPSDQCLHILSLRSTSLFTIWRPGLLISLF